VLIRGFQISFLSLRDWCFPGIWTLGFLQVALLLSTYERTPLVGLRSKTSLNRYDSFPYRDRNLEPGTAAFTKAMARREGSVKASLTRQAPPTLQKLGAELDLSSG
jgi:hypothetical protein